MKKKLSGILAVLLVLLMAVSLAACGPASEAGEESSTPVSDQPQGNTAAVSDPEKNGTSTIYVQVASDPGGLDPFFSGSFQLRYLVEENLFTYDYDGHPVPCAMESYEIADDGMTMTVHVPENFVTHNGYQITAQDYLWSISMVMSSSNVRYAKIFDLENSYVVDDLTVVLALAERWTDFNYASCMHIPVISQAAYEASPDGFYSAAEGGTGPYKVESYTEGSEIVLVKNEDYWGGENSWASQNVDRIVCKVVSEDSQKTIEFEGGYVDFLSTPSSNDIEYLRTLDYADVYQEPLNKNNAILFNCVSGATSNQLVRQAIACAIDNAAICEQAFRGTKITATSVINPIDMEWDDSMYDNSYDRYAYNTEKARELLEEAGYAGGLTLSLSYSSAENGYDLMAQIIQAELADVGITVSIAPYDAASFATLMAGNEGWDICLTPYKISDTVLFHFYNLTNKNTTQRGGWYNEEFQTMLDEAIYTMDEDTIMQMVEIYETECPFYAIAYDASYFVARKGIDDFKVMRGDNWYFPNDWSYSAEADWLYD